QSKEIRGNYNASNNTQYDTIKNKRNIARFPHDAEPIDKKQQQNTRLACRGERPETRKPRKCTLCLPRRAHRDKINAKIHALLATASALPQQKMMLLILYDKQHHFKCFCIISRQHN